MSLSAGSRLGQHDILALQSDVARSIAREIQVKLTPQEDALLAPARRIDPRAHELYLKGRHHWNKFTPDGFAKAVGYFEQAIDKDPNHAMAYASLADSHWIGSFWGSLPPRQAYPQAREAIKKAIEIDDNLGEAHATLASIHTHYDWDFEAAEREFKRALELAPGSSDTRLYYSFYLNIRRRHDEAIAQAVKSQELDPLSPVMNTHLGHRLWQARRYDEAIEEFEKWLAIDPDNWFAHHHLGLCYQEKSMIKEALAEVDRAVELSGGVAMVVANAILAHFRFGDKEVAERLFEYLKERARQEYIPPMGFVYIHLVRGERDQAFEWAQKACEERDSFLVWARVTPLDSLQLPSEPRIDELFDRLGLP